MAELGRRLKMGMVGGGPGSFAGEAHRLAARLEGSIELMAGAFSTSAQRNRQMGAQLLLSPERVYPDYQAMIRTEQSLSENQRVDFVSIVTPNHLHLPMCRDFLRAGFHVVCDKPLALNLEQALELREAVRRSGRQFAVTYNYPGYPMVKLARDLVAQGELGSVRKILVYYQQGWMADPVEQSGLQPAIWRTDPQRSGLGGAIVDVGTHAFNLAEYISGLRVTELCADLASVVPGRRLDDDGSILLRFNNGARGILHASQISVGQENGFGIHVYGERASLEWRQEDPNFLWLRSGKGPQQMWSRGQPYVAARSPAAERATRISGGHPEGFFEAFANVYHNIADTLRATLAGGWPDPLALDFATVDEGVRGMAFIEAAVHSAHSDRKWTVLASVQ